MRNYEFDYPQTNDHYVVTAVKGHLMASDFYDTHKNWQSCDPFALFDADINVFVPNDNKAMERNILTLSRNADMLMIWTDCDREGEHIGSEISRIARRGKRNIVIKRARFSAIIPQCVRYLSSIIIRAYSNYQTDTPRSPEPCQSGPGASRCSGSSYLLGLAHRSCFHSNANHDLASGGRAD